MTTMMWSCVLVIFLGVFSSSKCTVIRFPQPQPPDSIPSIIGKASSLKARVTRKVIFDIAIDGTPVGSIVLGLFDDMAPKTVENFVQLASGNSSIGWYKGAKFHRVIKDFMIQGGDIDKRDGSGSTSIYGELFDDESFNLNHYGSGWLSMANRGPNTNGCQFFITMRATKWLDGSHVVFGKVVEGMDVARKIEVVPTDANDQALVDVVITDSRAEDVEPFEVELKGVDNVWEERNQ